MLQPLWLQRGHEPAAPAAPIPGDRIHPREGEGWESGGLHTATPGLLALSTSVQGNPGGGMQLSPSGCAAWSWAEPSLLHSLS